MKPIAFFGLALTAALAFAASTWEGSAVVGNTDDFPTDGYYGASNSFAPNSIIEVTNIENGKSVTVRITRSVDNPGVFIALSPNAANAIGMDRTMTSRIRAVDVSAQVRSDQPAAGRSIETADPDYNPKLLADRERALLDQTQSTATQPLSSQQPVTPLVQPSVASQAPSAQSAQAATPYVPPVAAAAPAAPSAAPSAAPNLLSSPSTSEKIETKSIPRQDSTVPLPEPTSPSLAGTTAQKGPEVISPATASPGSVALPEPGTQQKLAYDEIAPSEVGPEALPAPKAKNGALAATTEPANQKPLGNAPATAESEVTGIPAVAPKTNASVETAPPVGAAATGESEVIAGARSSPQSATPTTAETLPSTRTTDVGSTIEGMRQQTPSTSTTTPAAKTAEPGLVGGTGEASVSLVPSPPKVPGKDSTTSALEPGLTKGSSPSEIAGTAGIPKSKTGTAKDAGQYNEPGEPDLLSPDISSATAPGGQLKSTSPGSTTEPALQQAAQPEITGTQGAARTGQNGTSGTLAEPSLTPGAQPEITGTQGAARTGQSGTSGALAEPSLTPGAQPEITGTQGAARTGQNGTSGTLAEPSLTPGAQPEIAGTQGAARSGQNGTSGTLAEPALPQGTQPELSGTASSTPKAGTTAQGLPEPGMQGGTEPTTSTGSLQPAQAPATKNSTGAASSIARSELDSVGVVEPQSSGTLQVQMIQGKKIPVLDTLAKGSYYIQVGSFSRESALPAIVQKLGQYPLVLVKTHSKTNQAIWQILIGPLSKDEYGVILVQTRSRGFKDAFVRTSS